MRPWMRTYTAYSVGCWIVWAVLLIAGALAGKESPDQAVLYVFLGWVIGWLSATIARSVYPPPKRTLVKSSTRGGWRAAVDRSGAGPYARSVVITHTPGRQRLAVATPSAPTAPARSPRVVQHRHGPDAAQPSTCDRCA
jgi:hypothetical protein